jgi:predicted nuclease with RNAse H fold
MAEQQQEVTLISLAARVGVVVASVELWRVTGVVAAVQYLAAGVWGRLVQMLLTLRVRVLPAQARVVAAAVVAPALAALAVPVS